MNEILEWLERQRTEDPDLYRQLLTELRPSMRTPPAITDLEGVASLATSVDPTAILESIIRSGRPAFLVQDGRLVLGASPDAVAAGITARTLEAAEVIAAAVPLVGRIDVEGRPGFEYVGTGWLVDPEVVVTNRHVAEAIVVRQDGGIVFRTFGATSPVRVSLDLLREHGNHARDVVQVERVIWMADRVTGPDVALLKVTRVGDGSSPDRLMLAPDLGAHGLHVAAIGYPARGSADAVPDQRLMDEIYGGIYGVKRVAPGRLGTSRGEEVTHDCTTLGGNSGSVIVDLDTGQAVALHYAGRYMLENHAVSAMALGRILRTRPWEAAPTNASGSCRDMTVDPGRDGTPGAAAAALRSSLKHDFVEIRPGYLLRDGEMTDDPCIVVSVEPRLWNDASANVPPTFRGWPVVVRDASVLDRLATFPAEMSERVTSVLYDDDARRSESFNLGPITEPMVVQCHVGPDRGWEMLSGFLEETKTELVCGMYELHAAHVAQALEAALWRGCDVTLTMGSQSRDPSDGLVRPGEFLRSETFARWTSSYKGRFRHAFVPAGSAGLVASSYHMKVAVSDSSTTWLSSGNWRETSQPEVTPERRDDARVVSYSGNREWHLLVQSQTLAGVLRNHLRADLARCAGLSAGLASEGAETCFMDIPDKDGDEALDLEAPARDVFETMRVGKVLTIRPLLTPDAGGATFRDAVVEMIASAERRIYLQQQYVNVLQSQGGHLSRIVDALIEAAATRTVRVILRSGASGLLENLEHMRVRGLDVDRCVRVLAKTHVKGMIVDGRRILVGSHNWSEYGVSLNRDASLLVEDPEVAGYYERVFEMDWDRARRPRFPGHATTPSSGAHPAR